MSSLASISWLVSSALVALVVVDLGDLEVAPGRSALPSSSTICDVVDQPVEGLALAQVRAYRRELVALLERQAHLGRGLLDPLGQLLELVVEVVLGDLEALGLGDGPQGEVGLGGQHGGLPQLGDDGLLVLAGGRQVLLEVHALGLEPHEQVLEPVLHLGGDHRLGHVLVVDELAGASGPRRCAGPSGP